ncbi:MAG: PIG-L deacetylase family protein [Crocinitomicaceae bacterium]|jgi:LmbE family N-acetylglucosaminyl deacetylase
MTPSTRFLNFKKVLGLSPHPDDIEYGMSGTILKYPETHFDLVCMTKGGHCDETTSSLRHQEMKNFWEGVSNVTIHTIDFDAIMEGEDFIINFLEKTILTNHELILTPSNIDNHFFHKKINNLGPALCRIKPISLMEYFTPSTSLEWIPNFVVNLEDEIYLSKKQRLKKFTSQSNKTYFSDFCLDSFHSSLEFTKKGLHWVEKFRSKSTILF